MDSMRYTNSYAHINNTFQAPELQINSTFWVTDAPCEPNDSVIEAQPFNGQVGRASVGGARYNQLCSAACDLLRERLKLLVQLA